MKTEGEKRPRPAGAPRRPYTPPAVRREDVFETVAAGCTQFTKAACGAGFQAS